MSVQGISAANGGYYGTYETNTRRKTQVSFNGQQQEVAQAPKKKQKTGFWEGVGALCKGFFVNTIANMIKHPVATLAGIAVTTALIIGTQGAAIPFLIAAGIGLGSWQVGKGTVNAIMADSREETLKALEEAGEGIFAIAASAIGAKNYAAGLKSAASTTSATAGEAATATATTATATAGEAAANPTLLARAGAGLKAAGSKTMSYLGEVKTGVVETVKAAPESYRTSMAMIKSGEFTGNLKSAAGSLKLAIQQRNAENLKEIGSYKYAGKQDKYETDMLKHLYNNDDRVSIIVRNYFKAYNKLCDKGLQNSPQAKTIEKAMYNLLEKGLVSPESLAAIKNGLNPKLHIPESIATVITTRNFNGDGDEYIPNEPQEQMPYYYPYYQGYSYSA